MLADWLQRQWFERRRLSPALWLLLPLLLPLNLLFIGLSGWRRWRTRPVKLPVPVVVVGNITVGGAGKTPLTLWLARQLTARGLRPGIVSRGYGSEGGAPRPVRADSSPEDVGDEPLLLARRAGVPVFVGRDRSAAGRALLAAHPDVNVILCDDGLQHYRLGRDVELAVFDARGIGNGWRLPLGPLREPLARLLRVDAVVCNGGVAPAFHMPQPRFDMALRPARFHRLDDPAVTRDANDLQGKPLHALAGIGDPRRFFRTLESLGLEFEAHPFPDHYAYSPEDLGFSAHGVLLMTEKDAVKCTHLKLGETWVLPVEAELSPGLVELILEKINGRQAA